MERPTRIALPRGRVLHPAAKGDRVTMKQLYIDDIPPDSNPYHYDATSSGVSASNEWEIMTRSGGDTIQQVIHVNRTTGQRLKYVFLKEKPVFYSTISLIDNELPAVREAIDEEVETPILVVTQGKMDEYGDIAFYCSHMNYDTVMLTATNPNSAVYVLIGERLIQLKHLFSDYDAYVKVADSECVSELNLSEFDDARNKLKEWLDGYHHFVSVYHHDV